MHWNKSGDNLVPPGSFGKYMSRDEFRCIAKFLTFCDGKPKKVGDRFYRLRFDCVLICITKKTCY
jgi:hypothetical protein